MGKSVFSRLLMGLTLLATAAVVVVSAVGDEDSVHPLRTHSIYMPYIDQDLQNRWFDFGGDALINTNKHIRLTSDIPSQTGYLWSRLPVTASSFQVEFEFKVEGKGDGLYGDGFAVWLTKDRAVMGPVFGNKDEFEGLGIFFDTYANSRQSHSFPYVMAMMGDGRTSYDSAHDGASNKLGGCESDFRGKVVPTKARITYHRDTGYLNLKLQTRGWDEWDECFTLSNIKLPTISYLGFTSVTGEVHDNHDIISVTTSTLSGKADTPFLNINNTPPPQKKTGVMWYLKFLAACAVFVALVMAFKMSKSSNDNLKRF
ncbi:putative lectin family integral membrane protein [Linnemannia elongata]|nr:putative lectin family integral membrane protein [Linnemannia elongata]